MAFEMADDAAEFYELGMGPAMFEPFAREMAARMPGSKGQKVLEVACGTGILTRRLPNLSHVVATDFSEKMISVARQRCSGPGWLLADMNALPLSANSFDIVVCQFGLMFTKIPVSALGEMRRVLRPGGLVWVSTWGSLDQNPFAVAGYAALRELLKEGEVPFLDLPFRFGDRVGLEEMLLGAGLKAVKSEVVNATLSVNDLDLFARGFVLGGPLRSSLLAKGYTDLQPFVDAVRKGLFKALGKPIRSEMTALFACGTA